MDMTISRIQGLSDDETALVNKLMTQLVDKQRRNALRDSYYDSTRLVNAITDAVPPLYNQLGLVLGWSQKAVDLLARRCRLDDFVWPDGDIEAAGVGEIIRANHMHAEVPQALTSSLTHSVAFAVVGDREGGGPAYIHFYDARHMTAIRDSRKRTITSALSIDDADGDGQARAMSLLLDGRTIVVERTSGRWRVVDDNEHDYGVPVFPLAYRPRLGRPFGASRITRPMMSIQDQAVRELVRLEGHMDVFSFPELWMLGADLSIFDEAAWKVRMGRLKGVADDDTAENPRIDIRQIAAAAPDPHLATLNAFAKLFAREASLPDSSLAITDLANPTSADAYDASQYDLIADAEGAVDGWAPSLNEAMALALAITNGQPVETFASVQGKWRNARFYSRAAEADAGLKQIMAVPELANTDVGLELLGLSEQQIDRVLGERRRNRSAQMLGALATAAPEAMVEDGDAG